MRPEPFRLERSVYPYFRRVIARFSDMDSEGHLNNVALASFYEDGRVSFLRGLIGEIRIGVCDTTQVVAGEGAPMPLPAILRQALQSRLLRVPS